MGLLIACDCMQGGYILELRDRAGSTFSTSLLKHVRRVQEINAR